MPSHRTSGTFVAALFLAAAACGGHKGGGSTIPDSSGGQATGPTDGSAEAPTEVSADTVCARIFELKGQSCDMVAGYDLTEDECVADYSRSLGDRGDAAHVATLTAGHCLLDHPDCAGVTQCFDQLDNAANNGSPQDFRACAQTDVYAPVAVSPYDWDNRKGASPHFFREVNSTKDDPVEVCGIPSEMTWLLAAKCDDGSNPYGESDDRAHASRVGNVGAGGLCGSIVDLYEVPCAEGTYSVFIDAYVCAAPPGMDVPRTRTRVPLPPDEPTAPND